MPNCYHVVNPGRPEEIARDIRECVDQVGGGGRLVKLKKRRGANVVHAWTRYDGIDGDAARQLLYAVAECLEDKGHLVSERAVLGTDQELDLEGSFEELGLEVEGYEPEPDEPGTAA